jgi:SET domain-containing protein
MSKLNALKKGERCHSDWCEVRKSGIHGRGLFAKKDIPEGTPIIQYVGEKITKEESHVRGWAQIDLAKITGDAAVYIFTLDDEYDIDGNLPENSARLINHSCEPNCEAYIDGETIWISAMCDISKDAELFYNYGFDLECYEDHPCYCGSKKCVGHIAGEEYWPKLKRKLAAKKSKGKARAIQP